ncbi:hypothetical protein [Dokdonia sp.]|uniref:hypothetical protein n=1 Tax=Dokdonia sp. TaxID=2024995 RepID=UPI00326515C1
MKLSLFLLILLLPINTILYSQNHTILEPEIPMLEGVLYQLLDDKKITNPTYLLGNIKEVETIFTLHTSPDNKTTETYTDTFILNTQRQVTRFESSDEYSEREPSSFNERPLHFKNDTIFKSEDYTYVFSKGRLLTKYGFEDSTSYIYKKDKLLTIKEYKRDVLEEWEEENDEITLYYSEFELKSYQEAVYDKELLVHKKTYDVFYETINTYVTNYEYDHNNRLQKFNVVYKRYISDLIDLSKDPKKWKFSENYFVDGEILNRGGMVSYDNANRIIAYQVSDSNNNEERYTISYSENDMVVKGSRKDYAPQRDVIIPRDLEYVYIYDAQDNPIEIRSYIVNEGEKILDKSTMINITYY